MLAGKCEESRCTSLTTDLSDAKTDLDVVKACFNDPSDATNCQGNNYISTYYQYLFQISYIYFICFVSATYGNNFEKS